MPGCVITLPKTVSPKTASERLDLSFGIFARRGEKYSCYACLLCACCHVGYGLIIAGDDKALKLIQIWSHLYKIHNYSMHDHNRKVDEHNFDEVECFVSPY